jgi:hypothetical protein
MSKQSKYSTYALLMVIAQWPLQSEEVSPAPQANKIDVLDVKGSDETSEAKLKTQEHGVSAKKSEAADSTKNQLKSMTSGFVSATYRMRTNEHTDDHDLYTTLVLNVNEGGKTSFHFLGRLAMDLDSDTDQSGYYVYDSVADSSGKNVQNKIISAYADINELGTVEKIRLGRQVVDGTPEIAFFDGLSVDSIAFGDKNLKAGLYGGVPVRYYGYYSEDRVMGGHVQMKPTQTTKARLDWMSSSDERSSSSRQDDLFSLQLEKQFLKSTRLQASYSMLENEARDMALRGYYRNVENDLSLSAYMYSLIQTQKNFAFEVDPFYRSTQELYPYYKGSLVLSKGIGDELVVDMGIDLRRVKESKNVGTYNREYERYFITPMLLNKPWEGSTCSVTIDYWDSGSRELWAYGADLGHKCSDKLEASIGTLFSMYKYDLYNNEEKEDVQTYFLKAKYKMSDVLRLNTSYEYEMDNLESYHVIKLGIVCLF